MTRYYVGVKRDGRREVFKESTGTYPTAQLEGYEEMCGPYNSENEAAKAAKARPSVNRGGRRERLQT